MSAALAGLREDGGACLFVVGEPGVGKSRLADELVAQAQREGAWVLCGRAHPTCQAIPYQSLSAALLHGLRSRSVDVVADPLVRAGLATLLPGFGEAPAADPSPVLLAETVLRLVADIAGEEGALLVLEDLHWACGDTLAVLEHLAHNVAAERLLVLATSRNEGEALPLIDALDRRGVASLSVLEPLSVSETAEMAAACLADDRGPVPAAVTELLNAQAEGLPFLVEELLAGLVTRGTLIATSTGWELRGERGTIDVPFSFSQTVRERMSELSAHDRRIVECAALVGRDFDWSHLPRIAHAEEAAVLEALSLAVDLQLVEETGGDRFRFRHALTVEAILAVMLDPQRARLAARALDDLVEDTEEVSPDLLGLAAHLATQAGRDAEACRYLMAEARLSLASGALATATATARRARASLRHGPTLPSARARRVICGGPVEGPRARHARDRARARRSRRRAHAVRRSNHPAQLGRSLAGRERHALFRRRGPSDPCGCDRIRARGAGSSPPSHPRAGGGGDHHPHGLGRGPRRGARPHAGPGPRLPR